MLKTMLPCKNSAPPDLLSLIVLSPVLLLVITAVVPSAVADDEDVFRQVVAPLLAEHCLQCHGDEAQEGNLRLDTFAGFAAGGTAGPVVVPNLIEESLLVSAIEYADEALQMPPDGKLPDDAIAAIKSWIANGAHHPDGDLTPRPVEPPFDVEEARTFWAFQPPTRPVVPSVRDAARVKSPIDAFVISRLEADSLPSNEPATKTELIRRATFDLTGLPPTPAEIDAFVYDQSPQAYRRVVDRLLDSPHYGERWGRHWLDVVRYADSNGLDENVAHGNAWRYRDYVIASFNADEPFDQFLREQIAGDLLIDDSTPEDRRNELLTATGFLALGAKVLAETDKVKLQMDIVDEQIDTLGKAFLGMTFGCARCHDHKFDPVSQADYYAMVGIFKSTHTMESLKTIAKWNENAIATGYDKEKSEQHQRQLETKKADIERVVAEAQVAVATASGSDTASVAEDQFPESSKQQLASLREELRQLEASVPVLPTAMGVIDGEVASARINVRGSHLTLGRRVQRGVPVVFHDASELQIDAAESGRKQLADWLTDRSHPLTARVLVNRIWRWHFGRGLVATTENFGHLGTPPTHPELLDWLATELVEQGWSLKHLHRTIMLSSTYRQSSNVNEAASAVDQENHLLWRFNPRRLEAEEIRDSVLFVSGLLDDKQGGSILNVGNREFIFDHTSKDNTSYESFQRSVYLPVIRNNLYDVFALFDYTDAAVPNGDRSTSTVAPQALYLLNSPLFLNASSKLSARLLSECPNDEARVQRLYQLAFGRAATADEIQRTLAFAQQFAAAVPQQDEKQDAAWTAICQSVLASNEFVYVR